ncbi:hypothetical protein GNF18_08055 [Ligilactobacillus pobuzihii]|uniref:hypothetical protein n=1 Tax=Ligilactobacillus pobuzihii TaxID=449659 RepID=UPI0019D10E5E|nr:hypothetical protein [Ligilactobacillus pobuzihii]MBN7275088.1 hypothetical protein [Ligilactobacillus pobuzihii]
MTATREDVRQSVRELVDYWDNRYGIGKWGEVSSEELDNCEPARKVRRILLDPNVKIRDRGGTPLDDTNKPDIKSKAERDEFIIRKYKENVPATEIARVLGYKTTSAVYGVLQKADIDSHIKKQGINVTREQLLEAVEVSESQNDVAKRLSTPEHTIRYQSISVLLDKYHMQDAKEMLKRRFKVRYLVQDGRMTKFNSMQEIANYFGVSKEAIYGKVQRKQIKILTWGDVHNEDI